MVDVGVSELRHSRDRLAGQGEAAEAVGANAVSGLLFFYAAECGLKAELLRWVLQRPDTAALPAHLRTHDLRRLAKALNLQDPGSGPDPLRCHRHKGGGWIESHELHEAWRYGAELRADDQKAAVEALKALLRDVRKGP
ncbi:hypothetical protein [Streptomyces niveiscabiei]|uniref:HEPN domain-containing protein n=1 Tax=Streptomyces niveiscabiei TaxID=164115 RepID=A0ABW9HTW9_9ACTN